MIEVRDCNPEPPLPKHKPEHLGVPPVTAMDDPRILRPSAYETQEPLGPFKYISLAGWSRAGPETGRRYIA